MKQYLILAALLSSSVLLMGCTNKEIPVENIAPVNTGDVEENILAMPETIVTESGETILLSGSETVSNQIKSLIEKRKEEMKTETGNEKELNEKDIEFLEAVVEKLSQKK